MVELSYVGLTFKNMHVIFCIKKGTATVHKVVLLVVVVEKRYTQQHCTAQCVCLDPWVLVGKWADPSGTAMLGQPMNESEQAPELIPLSKISLISKGTHGPRIRY